ncbi:unnamed protein product [Dovyalis caffra]|uniref:Uncharacterized protein n=1 Tax=Dovyalis caffra TaxID=77055 RepID=A0AAV1RKE9_9ROSI|nr:unnamed protein product [Dovyalis caffra]
MSSSSPTGAFVSSFHSIGAFVSSLCSCSSSMLVIGFNAFGVEVGSICDCRSLLEWVSVRAMKEGLKMASMIVERLVEEASIRRDDGDGSLQVSVCRVREDWVYNKEVIEKGKHRRFNDEGKAGYWCKREKEMGSWFGLLELGGWVMAALRAQVVGMNGVGSVKLEMDDHGGY